MAIATEDSAALFTNIVASTPLNCNFPLYEADEVEVVYGSQALIAVYPTDYTVQLNEAEDFEDFTITPTASLLTKINALIATPPTSEAETNFVVVRRKLDYLTSVEPETVRYTPFLSKEIDRIHMKLIQLAERVARNLGLPANVVGELTDNYTISAPVEGKAPVWRGNKLVAEIDAANIAGAEGFAAAAAASALVAEGHADDALGYAVDAANSKDAAQAAAAGMRWRPPVRAATTGALPACTYANGTGGVGATLTGNANGALAAQDGVTLIAANRLLVKDQVASLQNGVYDVTQVGSAGTPFILTRATDADSWTELVSQVVIAEEGTTQKDLAYICTVDQGGTLGTNIVTWVSFNPPLVIASQAEAEAGTENTKAISALRAKQAIDFQVPSIISSRRDDILILQDQKASGTDGGTFTSGAWQTRTLNTEVYDGVGSTLSSNQFTLPAGTYKVFASAPAFSVSQHQVRLQNVTDAVTVALGDNELTNPGAGDGSSKSTLHGVFTIAGTKTFELQHRCAVTKALNGYGVNSAFGTEVYAQVIVEKIA